ncbi:26S proteasome beta type 7 subunit [Tribonema minus]|uniref:proteasome endopeptidase complex n=1 Tax=Tribonema minus TaxID=303371 RepID=A0A835ZKI2_9STRA|nr:26S proteasome beta type 7 subunit [Tribonema minus]
MSELTLSGSVPAQIREAALADSQAGGFNFENCHRNARIVESLAKEGVKGGLPRAKLTGTTICGCVYKDGIVLGADTRATGGTEVCDKNCEKIHYLAPNIYCCGAGTAADTEKTTELISSQLDLLRLSTGTQSRVVTACTMLKRMLFRYQGHVSAALVLGGVDATGPHLYNIYPHGSSDKLPYVTMGSGSLAAMSVFETGYKEDMTEEEATDLVKEAILAGIFNDLGSGSNCDITVIRKGEVSRHRGYVKPNELSELRATVKRPPATSVPLGATKVLATTFHKFIEVETVPAPEPMAI